MAPIDCPKCHGTRWHASGHIHTSRRNLQRAELVCDRCGYHFTSGLPKALDAAAAERGDCELTPDVPVAVPQPSLTLPGAHVRRHQGFVGVGELARRAVADYKRRQIGEDE